MSTSKVAKHRLRKLSDDRKLRDPFSLIEKHAVRRTITPCTPSRIDEDELAAPRRLVVRVTAGQP